MSTASGRLEGVSKLAALTPYHVPPSLRAKKIVNLGDGFILRGIERLIGRFDSSKVCSPRVAPSYDEIRMLEGAPGVVLAGANQLTENYTVWPGLTADRINTGTFRFIPFGIGLHGDHSRCETLSHETKAVLEAIHARIEFSSWRCPRTVTLLQRELPRLSSQFLMTGCPVLYDRLLLESSCFNMNEGSVAVTATERNDFWERETKVIDLVARRFPHARRYFVTHQNRSPPMVSEVLRHRLTTRDPRTLADPVEGLRLYARKHGFEVVIPRDADACVNFYEAVDVHVGSRLHAHLLFLSKNKRSFLIPIDQRSVGMSEYFGFPAGSPDQLDTMWDWDFELVREKTRAGYEVMQQFVRSLA